MSAHLPLGQTPCRSDLMTEAGSETDSLKTDVHTNNVINISFHISNFKITFITGKKLLSASSSVQDFDAVCWVMGRASDQ